jgi:hypothetical protein
MGNFVSGQRKQYTDCGVILGIELLKNRSTGSVEIGKLDYIPTYVSASTGHRILPVADAMEAIKKGEKSHPAYTPDAGEQVRIFQVWKETIEHLKNSESRLQVHETNE